MNENTEDKILAAAKKVFQQKGYAGTSMRDIAAAAEINKGLLHYYFKSKDNLFRAVFLEAFVQMIPKLEYLIEEDMTVFEKVRSFVDIYMTTLIENPHLPSFILSELSKNSKVFIAELFEKIEKPNILPFFIQLYEEVEAGIIKPINPLNLMLNMTSMCVFPFVAKPLASAILNISDEDYSELMEIRKKEVADFIISAISAK